MNDLIHDLRSAVRHARRKPWFSLGAIGMLAVGIGVTVAIYTAADAVLLRPLPFRDPDQLALIWHRVPETGSRVPVTAPVAAYYRANTQALADLGFSNRIVDASFDRGDGQAVHVRVAGVTTNFFSVLGVVPAAGRTFADGEGLVPPFSDIDSVRQAVPTSLVLSHAFWQRAFAGDPGVIGRSARIDGQPVVVIGVLPPDFELPVPSAAGTAGRADVWSPLPVELAEMGRSDRFQDQDSDIGGVVLARLRADATLPAARVELETVARRLAGENAAFDRAALRVEVQGLHADVVARVRPVLVSLLGGATLMLIVACVNLAGLLTVQGVGRWRELAVRRALGASAGRLMRQLLAETVVLSTAGVAGGILIAVWLTGGIRAFATGALPRVGAMAVDLRVLGFTAGIALLVTLATAMAPVLLSRRMRGHDALRTTAPTRIRGGVRRGLVFVEVALAMPILVAAGLLVRTVRALDSVPTGFDPANAVALDIGLRGGNRYRGPADRARFLNDLESRLVAQPGVEAVGSISRAPLSGRRWTDHYALAGESLGDPGLAMADFRPVTPGYFDAVGTPLIAGRAFTAAENRIEERRIAIVDETLAARLGGPLAALRQRVTFPLDGRAATAEIVGVVEPVRFESLREGLRPAVYVPYRQEASRDVTIVARIAGDPDAAAAALRPVVQRADPALAVYNVRALAGDVARAEAPTRFALALLALFAVVAVGLALVGLYAQIAFTVRSRAREIGVRLAVGGAPRAVVAGFFRAGVHVIGAGIALGAVLALFGARLVRAMLFGVAPADPATYVIAAVLVGLAGAIASYVPARRAARVDPMEALRHE